MFIQEHNATTGEISYKDLTEEEIQQKIAESQAMKAETAAKAAAKAALLERLGITEEEAKLLLG